MRWEELSWPQLDALDRNLPVVVPLGSCEQHGLHLPLFVDSIQVSTIAARVEAEMPGEILLVPTLWLGSSHHHRDFPGTLSLRPIHYVSIIQEIARSILRAGFRRLFFLNGHGGNIAPATTALVDLIAECNDADAAHIALSSWWRVAADELRPEIIGVSQNVVAHACAYETSLMLAIRPDLVDTTKISPRPAPALQNAWFHSEDDSQQRVSVFHRFHRYSADGVLGACPEATVESGEMILGAAVQQVRDFLRDFRDWPPLQILQKPHA
jgi:creatinine amidohydrolase